MSENLDIHKMYLGAHVIPVKEALSSVILTFFSF